MINQLVILILSLLIQVQQPNVPLATKVQALQLAQQVLAVAQEQQAQQTPSTPETVLTPVSGSVDTPQAPVIAAPTCTLSAPLVAWRTTWHAQFQWTYTPGAIAKITENGSEVPLNVWNGQSVSITQSDSSMQPPVYGPAVFSDTDYVMEVQLGDQSGSCTAHLTATSTPPAN